MIPIIWGERLYGAVDRIHGVFYVATRFFHLWFVPLIPLQSFLIFHGTESGNGFKGVPIPMSMKSVLTGWLRAACVLGAPIALIVGLAGMASGRALDVAIPILLACVAGLAFWLSYVVTKADHARARELAFTANLPEELVQALIDYGPGVLTAPRPAPPPAARPVRRAQAAPPAPPPRPRPQAPVAPPKPVEAIDYDPESGL